MNWEKHGYNNSSTNTNHSYDNDLSVISPNIPENQFIKEKLKVAINDFFNYCNLHWIQGINKFSTPRFNKYGLSTEMRLHVDHISSIFDGVEKGVPIITILGSLNEGYKGGDFLMFDGEVVPMNEGTLLIFPSNFLYPHQVTPITKGTRYSFVSWGW